MSKAYYIFKIKHEKCPLTYTSQEVKGPLYIFNLYTFRDKSYFILRSPRRSRTVYRLLKKDRIVRKISIVNPDRGVFSVVKDSFGVMKALGDVGGFLIAPVVVFRGYKNFLVLLQAKRDVKRLAQEIINNSPNDISLRYFEVDGFMMFHILSTINMSPYSNISTLDPKQFEAIKTAWEMGYYRWPKRASLKDVASRLNLSMVSTLKRLRNAESRIIGGYLSVLNSYDITPSLFNSSRSLSE